MASHRKRHNKSRAGCLTCKSRRVKCDEGRPSCQNCLRGHRDCSYTHGASPTSTSSPITAASNGNTRPKTGYNQERLQPFLPSTRSLSSQPFPGISRSQELYLMHHYATVTWSTLADTDSPEETDLWKNAIPREGLKYEFLMNALLAASSLHLAHLEPPRKQFYTTASLEYQSHGLNSFKTALDHIDGENVNALFAFSVIVTILAFRPDMHDSAPVDTLQSIFELLRGVGVISKTAEVNIQTGMFKSLLTPHGGPRPGCEITSSDEVENGMARLRGRADHIAKYVGPAHHEVYISCISSLQICFEHISTHQSIGTAIAWPVLISDKLIALFQQKDPMAQLIWIHYGVLLLYIHNRWWGRGFGVRLIESLSDSLHSLDEEWATFTQWPRERARIVSQKAETSC